MSKKTIRKDVRAITREWSSRKDGWERELAFYQSVRSGRWR
jgi:hypothetical protein